MASSDDIEGVLVLPGPLPASRALVWVRLVDASLADVPAEALASARFFLEGAQRSPIPFRLQRPTRLRGSRRWVFDATVTADPAGRVARGDYILDRNVDYAEAGLVSLNLVTVR